MKDFSSKLGESKYTNQAPNARVPKFCSMAWSKAWFQNAGSVSGIFVENPGQFFGIRDYHFMEL